VSARPLPGPEVYRFPRPELALWTVDLILGRRRSFYGDSEKTFARIKPEPRVENDHLVPSEGPFVVVTNHYERPGLRLHFAGMLVSRSVGRRRPRAPEVHWVTTSEWYGRRLGPIPVPTAVWRWLFRRVANMYGFAVMPRQEERRMGRAAALVRLAAYARGGPSRPPEPIGLLPEALGKGRLIEAQPGSGAFLKALSDHGIPVLPVGLFERGDVLTAVFGEPFRIEVSAAGSPEEVDRAAREQVMVAIGRLLPEEYWGFYADAIRESLGSAPAPTQEPSGER
jgi:hypothetical protein